MALSYDDQKFLDGCRDGVHPVTRLPIETGSGCLPISRQVELQCRIIEFEKGKAVADAIRAQLREMNP